MVMLRIYDLVCTISLPFILVGSALYLFGL